MTSRLFAWQAWPLHLLAPTFVLRGRRGSYGTGLGLVACLVVDGCRWSPVTPWDFACQAWHLATSTGVLRPRRGTLLAFTLVFAWQAWHLWHRAGSGGALGRRWLPVTPQHFAWQAWYLATSTTLRHFTWQAWRLVTSTFVLRGIGDIHVPFAWQAWHLATSTFTCVPGVALGALGWHWAGSGGAFGRC